MKVDALLFSDELDVLEMRFAILQDVVDVFIITEMPVTFSGKPKLLHFHENRKRFAKWMPKIWHNVVTGFPPSCNNPTPWDRENYQREQIRQYLINPYLDDNDLIVISDVDEIPNPEVFSTSPKDGILSLQMHLSYWYMNCRTTTRRAFSAKLVTGTFLKSHTAREIRWTDPAHDLCQNGGWHFAWLGSTERLIKKTFDYGHCNDSDTFPLREALANGLRPGLDCGLPLFPSGMVSKVPIDESFPKYVIDHRVDLIQQGYILA